MGRLPESDKIFRMVHVSMRDRRNKMIPNIKGFQPTPHDNFKLSVDWENKTTPEESLARFGATYKFNKNEFKDHNDFEVFSLEIAFVNSFDSIKEVSHDPIENNPPPIGTPNNPAHSLVHFSSTSEEDEPEIYLKLRDHADKISTNGDEVNELVESLRNQWQ